MLTGGDLGVLESLGTAIGFLNSSGNPEPTWFGAPEDSLKTILSDDSQREALIAFVDEALGGADRTTEDGVVWLPVVTIEDPHIEVYVTVDERPSDHVAIGAGIAFTTTDPASRTTASIPLFRAARTDNTDSVLLLGSIGGRLRLATSITIDEPEIGSIGVEMDIPTHPDDDPPVFGLTITDLQLPGATEPRDVHVSAAGADELDDAVLDLVLSLIKAQAAGAAGEAIAAIAGLLGLSGGAIPDFPIEQLATDGVSALAAWLRDVVDTTASRQAWLDHLADLIGGNRAGRCRRARSRPGHRPPRDPRRHRAERQRAHHADAHGGGRRRRRARRGHARSCAGSTSSPAKRSPCRRWACGLPSAAPATASSTSPLRPPTPPSPSRHAPRRVRPRCRPPPHVRARRRRRCGSARTTTRCST